MRAFEPFNKRYRWNHDSYDAVAKIERLLSLIDTLRDNVRDYKRQEPEYYYGG